MSKRSGQTGSVRLVGSKWYGRYRYDEQAGRVHKAVVLGDKRSMSKPEARRRLLTILEAEGINKPEHLEAALKPAETFNTIADAWEAKKLPTLFYSSQVICKLRLDKHIRPYFGAMRLEDIRTLHVNDWITQLNQTLEPKTVSNLWKLFRAVCNWHQRQHDKPKMTWYPDLPALPDREQRWFTVAQVDAIVNATTDPKYKTLFRLAGYTGMRIGELCALRVEDLKLDHDVIEVSHSVWEGHEGPTKTGKRRVVYLDALTVKMLREYLGNRQSGLVFPSRAGTPLYSREIVRCVLRPILEQLGIARAACHAFRHGRASHMQTNRMPADFILSQIGHSSLRTTSLYTHFDHKTKRNLTEQLALCAQTPEVCSMPN